MNSTGTGVKVIAEASQELSWNIVVVDGAGGQVSTLAAIPVVVQFLLVTFPQEGLGENTDPEECHVPDLTVHPLALLTLPLASLGE